VQDHLFEGVEASEDVPSGGGQWAPAVSNLDVFFSRMYNFYYERGFAVIVARRITNLVYVALTACCCFRPLPPAVARIRLDCCRPSGSLHPVHRQLLWRCDSAPTLLPTPLCHAAAASVMSSRPSIHTCITLHPPVCVCLQNARVHGLLLHDAAGGDGLEGHDQLQRRVQGVSGVRACVQRAAATMLPCALLQDFGEYLDFHALASFRLWAVLSFFVVYWMWSFLTLFPTLRAAWDMHVFFRDQLNIPTRVMQTMEW
jgi:hypothetical protein